MFRRLPTFLSLTFAATVGLFALTERTSPPNRPTDPAGGIKRNQEENLKLFKRFSEEVLRLGPEVGKER